MFSASPWNSVQGADEADEPTVVMPSACGLEESTSVHSVLRRCECPAQELHSCTGEACDRRLRGMEGHFGVHTSLVVSEGSLVRRRRAEEVEHLVEAEDSAEIDVGLHGAKAGGDASDLFVNAPDSDCDDLWASWPTIQESGLANKNAIVYKPLASVGNDFLRLQTLISVSNSVRVWLAGAIFFGHKPCLSTYMICL